MNTMMAPYIQHTNTLRLRLGETSKEFISDERLDSILRLTKQDVEQATLISLGYIIQMLNLKAQSELSYLPQNLLSQYQNLLAQTLESSASR